jgi:hypothetical protein
MRNPARLIGCPIHDLQAVNVQCIHKSYRSLFLILDVEMGPGYRSPDPRPTSLFLTGQSVVKECLRMQVALPTQKTRTDTSHWALSQHAMSEASCVRHPMTQQLEENR